MKFKEFRNYISKIDRVSICNKDTLRYENYQFISEVPATYDELYLYGIGRIQSEFPRKSVMEVPINDGDDEDETIFAECIEIMLSDEPRKFDE